MATRMTKPDRLYSVEGEAAVIASLVLDNSTIAGVEAILGPEAFFKPENASIYRAILNLHSGSNGDGQSIDAVVLRDALKQRGQLDQVGGADYLGKILDSVPGAANAIYYAGIVREHYRRRQLIGRVDRMREIIDNHDSVDEQIAEIRGLVEGLDVEFETGDSAVLLGLSDMEAEAMQFLWRNRIPSGTLSLILGDPNLGKTFLALYIAAKVSTGGLWPDAENDSDCAPKGSVVLLGAEDDLRRTVRPRLDSLGADASKIFALEAVKVRDDDGRVRRKSFNLEDDLPVLDRTVRQLGDVKLIIIDPLSAYLGGRVDSHRDADVRNILSPLVQFAEDRDITVLGIMHLNKCSTGKVALYRGMGSVAFVAAARTVWLVSKDPSDVNSKRRLLTPAKYNVLVDPTGLAFEIRNGRVEFEDEPVSLSADEALTPSGGMTSPIKDKAVAWLKEHLPPGKSVPRNELYEQAAKDGITEGTLRRAYEESGATSFPLTGPDHKKLYFWSIPEKVQVV
ncbi:MAG TPA: AAA family ATPase [Sedimentisphaerales bacterium]|nr:AAA family ATPase [Sedimentisphaerales bacterium]